jgi:hypothetical protein
LKGSLRCAFSEWGTWENEEEIGRSGRRLTSGVVGDEEGRYIPNNIMIYKDVGISPHLILALPQSACLSIITLSSNFSGIDATSIPIILST